MDYIGLIHSKADLLVYLINRREKVQYMKSSVFKLGLRNILQVR